MDTGQQLTVLVTGRLHWPNALAVDFQRTVATHRLTASLPLSVRLSVCLSVSGLDMGPF